MRQIIRRILREETSKLDKELYYLIANHKHIDDAMNKLKTIFNENTRGNKEKTLTFIEDFWKTLDALQKQVFLNAMYCEKVLGLINESRLKRTIIKEEEFDRTGINEFYDYYNYMVKLYYQVQKVFNEIKPTSDKETLKSNINNYYQLLYKDNNSMFELTKYISQLLQKTYNDISSNKTTKTSNKFDIDWGSKRIMKRSPNSEVIYLSPQKVLERVGKDMGSGFDIRNQGVRIGNRLEKAMEYLKNTDVEAYQPTALYIENWGFDDNGQKVEYKEPKVGISDGRHRLLAAFNLGLEEFPFEIQSPTEEEQTENISYLESNLK